MFYFGVDYYPEQWPEERWPIDAQLMSEAGFNVVRLAEFAWAKMEPVEGRFDFEWLDRAIAILQTHSIKVVLGTPTASPPPWLMSKSIDLFRVCKDGLRVTFGNRREYCPNQPLYHEYTRRIVTQMAEHYAGHPAVIGWQIDNEFGERCYCPACANEFKDWLRDRYKSIQELNQKWGTMFWSHVYNDWAEIPLPLATGGSPNPGLALDFYRFCSESYVAYQQLQVDILHTHCPGQFVTHNMMGFGYDQLNYFDLARDLDVVAYDNYPRSQWTFSSSVDSNQMSLNLATMHGLKGKPFWVLEQQAGSGGWEIISVTPRPGELRLWAYQSIAHGADAIVFFRWRTARFGTEQYWHGLLDHDGYPSRRYEEIKRMGLELERIGNYLSGAEVRSPVAMLLSYDTRFSFQIQPNNPYFSYSHHFQQIYAAFVQRHVSVDIVDPDADLSGYKLVIAPSLHLLKESDAESLKRYVQAGGVLVVTQRSGVKDEANAVVNQRLPGLLAEVCGMVVEEYDSLSSDMQNSLEFVVPELAGIKKPTVGVLCDILKPTSATVVARYSQEFYAGKPAITLNSFGKGQALYIGAVGDIQLYDVLAGWLLEHCGIKPILNLPKKIEVAERWQGGKRLIFLLNHNNETVEITLEDRFTDLLSSNSLSGQLSILPQEVLILTDGN